MLFAKSPAGGATQNSGLQPCSSNCWGRSPQRGSGHPVVSPHFSSLPCRNPLLGLKSGSTFGFKPHSSRPRAAPPRNPAAHMSCHHLPQRTAGPQRRQKNTNTGGHTSSGLHILCLLGRQLTTRALSPLRLTTGLQPSQEPRVVTIPKAPQEQGCIRLSPAGRASALRGTEGHGKGKGGVCCRDCGESTGPGTELWSSLGVTVPLPWLASAWRSEMFLITHPAVNTRQGPGELPNRKNQPVGCWVQGRQAENILLWVLENQAPPQRLWGPNINWNNPGIPGLCSEASRGAGWAASVGGGRDQNSCSLSLLPPQSQDWDPGGQENRARKSGRRKDRQSGWDPDQ